LLSNRTIRFLADDLALATVNSVKTEFSTTASVQLLDIVVIIPLTGDLQGNFVMSFEDEFARKIVSAYISDPIPADKFDEYLTDTVGKIANLIMVNTIENLPADLSDTEVKPPHILHNRGAELKQQNIEIVTCQMSTPAGQCNLNMQL
jgi:CheY-specific phosphatase CheX